MSYTRVIPRDFFNEAKLLNCMGHLNIVAGNEIAANASISITIDENGQPFEIAKDESSGDIYISNYECTVNGVVVRFQTNLNSRNPFPLQCYHNNTPYSVFLNSGELDSEFIDFANSLKA